MSVTAYVVVSPAVKVSVGAPGSVRAAKILRRGDLVPAGVDEAILDRLDRRGMIAEVKIVAHVELAGDDTDTDDDDAKTETDGGTDVFNPADHKADEVIAYLKDADADEVARVIEAETKAAKPRSTITDYQV